MALSWALGAGLGAQRPDDPLPAATRVNGSEIANLEAATSNVDWEEARVADLPRLSRLTRLRRLQINPQTDDGGGWPKVTPDDLAPLAALPALEILTIP